MPTVAYCRVSTEEQAAEAFSMDSRADGLRACAGPFAEEQAGLVAGSRALEGERSSSPEPAEPTIEAFEAVAGHLAEPSIDEIWREASDGERRILVNDPLDEVDPAPTTRMSEPPERRRRRVNSAPQEVGLTGGHAMSAVEEPAYLAAWRSGALEEKAQAAREGLRACRACPRDCGVDRLAGEAGVCRVGRHAVVAAAFPHHGEEDCLRGRGGSGTIFFAGCNLRCAFCQNWDISQQASGVECPAEDLAALMLSLQDRGCHNINLVTPEHVAPQVVEALARAVPRGLRLPLVYNTGAYDGMASLRLMDGLVDVYMPDFKFWEPSTARRLARAADYPGRAREAVREMHRQVGVLRLGRDGLARRGLLVRHLVMPGMGAEAAAIFGWLAGSVSPDTYLNIMGQYRPDHLVPASPRYADVARRPLLEEVAAAYEAARAAGLWRFDRPAPGFPA